MRGHNSDLSTTVTFTGAASQPQAPVIIEQLNSLNQQINFLQSHLGSVLGSVNRLASVDDAQSPCNTVASVKGVQNPDTIVFRLQDIETRLHDLVSQSQLISNHLSKLV
jgi:hypothetical protein